jgi:release factor glutamine methyltransferase
VPRPDTETVVELALEMLRADGDLDRRLRIADLGTGSGAILLALLSELPAAQDSAPTFREAPCKPPRQCSARGLRTRDVHRLRLCSGLSGRSI